MAMRWLSMGWPWLKKNCPPPKKKTMAGTDQTAKGASQADMQGGREAGMGKKEGEGQHESRSRAFVNPPLLVSDFSPLASTLYRVNWSAFGKV